MNEKLLQRRFPASPHAVREARNKIKKELRRKHEGEALTDEGLLDEKMVGTIRHGDKQ